MPDLQTLWLILRTLAIGLAGAFLFHLAGLPAAFMSGALVFVAIASLSGIRVQMPVQVRNVAFYLAGTFFGTTVTEETVSSLMAWPFSIAALACSLVLIMTVIPKYLEKVHGYDRETAILSSVPGVLSFVLALALDRGADVRRIMADLRDFLQGLGYRAFVSPESGRIVDVREITPFRTTTGTLAQGVNEARASWALGYHSTGAGSLQPVHLTRQGGVTPNVSEE